ncbi:MAG: glycyl-radical enzyme activating protein [Spirochaetes bacterium]|nr:MAG: glycyl-radical enzyme activating protein [Spirochaetota bacterium]RKX89320.1 MAG: glycyl-radical enzyme activating protein [Spirochaetota bacterium]
MIPSAMVFDIERYATDDGPGIRSVVFFKGCNLRCSWCQNPESHLSHPQIMYNRKQCTSCGRCMAACPADAIHNDELFGFITDPDKCIQCGACVDVCYTDARKIVGRRMLLDEIMEELKKDTDYYKDSGGGVTFSGGEPLLQADAVSVLAQKCKNEGFHTALETAGYLPWQTFEQILPLIDLLYFDLKHIDSDIHRSFTGVPIELILDNIRLAGELQENMVVRIPVIPGFNDSLEIQRRMMKYLSEETAVTQVELLPFHRFGSGKYDGLGIPYAMKDVENLSKSDCEQFAEIGRQLGLNVK